MYHLAAAVTILIATVAFACVPGGYNPNMPIIPSNQLGGGGSFGGFPGGLGGGSGYYPGGYYDNQGVYFIIQHRLRHALVAHSAHRHHRAGRPGSVRLSDLLRCAAHAAAQGAAAGLHRRAAGGQCTTDAQQDAPRVPHAHRAAKLVRVEGVSHVRRALPRPGCFNPS